MCKVGVREVGLLVVAALAVSQLPAASAAAPKVGTACTKANQKYVSGGAKLICAKSGSRLVWKKIKGSSSNPASTTKPSIPMPTVTVAAPEQGIPCGTRFRTSDSSQGKLICLPSSSGGSLWTRFVIPGPNEKFRFGPDVGATERAGYQEWTAHSVLIQEVMFGRQMTGFTTVMSRDVRWLAEEDCKSRPPGMPDCVGTGMRTYANVWAMGGCFPAPTESGCFHIANLANWSSGNIAHSFKVLVHEVHHILQQQIFPEFWRTTMVEQDQVRTSGPVWLWEGAAEWVGWKATVDLGMTTYTEKRADWENTAKEIKLPLSRFESVVGSRGVANSYQLYVLALDELLRLAPSGPGSLITFYTLTDEGISWQSAFEKAFGRTVDDFYQHFEKVRPT